MKNLITAAGHLLSDRELARLQEGGHRSDWKDGVRSFRYTKSLRYELKQSYCTKLSITSSIFRLRVNMKTFWVNILRSLRQVRGTIYNETE